VREYEEPGTKRLFGAAIGDCTLYQVSKKCCNPDVFFALLLTKIENLFQGLPPLPVDEERSTYKESQLPIADGIEMKTEGFRERKGDVIVTTSNEV
jgi:hypothetical protein